MSRHLPLALAAAAITALLSLGFDAPPAVADQGSAAAAAAGHCAFKLKNQWVGPLKACMDPATAEQCKTLGTTDENSEAAWSAANCPASGIVGTCRKSDSTLHYYEGDAAGLEVGCGFQGGEWKAGA